MNSTLDRAREWRPLWVRAAELVQGSARGVDALLTPRRMQVYPACLLSIGLVLCIASIAAGTMPFDVFGHPIAIDLSNRLTTGSMVLNGDVQHLYDLRRQIAVQKTILGGNHPEFLDVFISPPFVAYAYAPLAALPYVAAAVAWTALTVALLILDAHLLWPLVPSLQQHRFRTVLVVLLSSWPVLELIADGQDSAVSLLILIVGLRLLLAGKDVSAGAVLGLGLFKPQLYLLMPLLLLLQRRWGALVSWLLVGTMLTVTSIAAVGFDGLQSYTRLITSDALHQAILGTLNWKMQSLISLNEALIGHRSTAMVAGVTLAMDLLPIWFFAQAARSVANNRQSFILLYALAIVAGAIVSPYFFMYDCVILFLPALAFLGACPEDQSVRVSLVLAYVLTWSAPIRYLVFGHLPVPLSLVGAPWTVLSFVLLLVAGYRLWRREYARGVQQTAEALAT